MPWSRSTEGGALPRLRKVEARTLEQQAESNWHDDSKNGKAYAQQGRRGRGLDGPSPPAAIQQQVEEARAEADGNERTAFVSVEERAVRDERPVEGDEPNRRHCKDANNEEAKEDDCIRHEDSNGAVVCGLTFELSG